MGLVSVAEGGVLTLYLASGKRKHDRHFWVTRRGAEARLSWDKSKSAKPNKTETLVRVEPAPVVKTARQWFDEIDADSSGELDRKELATLYKRARGEKLPKRRLEDAMAVMDRDGDGQISFDEFERWWSENGGDLEKHRDRAMTIFVGDLQLLVVASDAETKRQWVSGLEAAVRGPKPAAA